MTRLASLALICGLLAACAGAPATPGPPTPTPSPSPLAGVGQVCADALRPLLEALEELDARLDVGLNKAAYSDRVGDISVAYNRIAFAELAAQPGCLTVGTLLEDAFNEYIRANSRWGDCISNTGCTTASIESELRRHWSTASDKIGEARGAFR